MLWWSIAIATSIVARAHRGPPMAESDEAASSGPSPAPAAATPTHSSRAPAASRTVKAPDATRMPVAPRLATSGPPIAVPSGVETSTIALRAASTAGRLEGVVADWNCA